MKKLLSVLLILLIGSGTPALSQRPARDKNLTMTWGLENTQYFHEGKQYAAGFVQFKIKPSRFYTFTNANRVHDRLDDCTRRHEKMWQDYKKDHPDSQSRSRDDFQELKRKSDPSCFAYAQEVAPTLYFDFETPNEDTYILKKIEIRTLSFEEYAGGGFTDNEAWYDLVVHHEPGDKTYEVENKLTFKNKGRAQLRLWSDNYDRYANAGWLTPMGAYLLKITFHFTHNGVESSVSTDAFQIDI